MNSDLAHRQIRSALRAELKRRHGQIGQIEAELSRSEGYLSRFCRGDMEMTLKGCLDALEALHLEPGAFFSGAFSTVTTSESLVSRLAGQGDLDRSFAILESTQQQICYSQERVQQSRRTHRADLKELTKESPEIQLRRFRTAKKYRDPVLVESYQSWLERLRFDEPKTAMRLAIGVMQHVLPNLAVAKDRQLDLFCRLLATYASSARALDDLHTAFSAVEMGLRISNARGLATVRGDLLRRGGAFCVSVPDYEAGLSLLREAQEIAYDDDDQQAMGLVVATKGMLLFYLGRELEAVKQYEKSLELLEPFDGDEVDRFRAAALSGLVQFYSHQQKFAKAKYWLAQAEQALGSGGDLLVAKLAWHQGDLERSVGQYDAAIASFRQALALLESGSVLDCALVSVELASTLLEAGRPKDAILVAKGMASLTDSMRENKLVQAALVEFLRIVLSGKLNLAILQTLKASLEEGHPQRKGALRNQVE